MSEAVDWVPEDLDELGRRLRRELPLSDLWFEEVGDDLVVIDLIMIKPEFRNGGYGTMAMREICDWADSWCVQLALTPASDFGCETERLRRWYEGFGFRRAPIPRKALLYREPLTHLDEQRAVA